MKTALDENFVSEKTSFPLQWQHTCSFALVWKALCLKLDECMWGKGVEIFRCEWEMRELAEIFPLFFLPSLDAPPWKGSLLIPALTSNLKLASHCFLLLFLYNYILQVSSFHAKSFPSVTIVLHLKHFLKEQELFTYESIVLFSCPCWGRFLWSLSGFKKVCMLCQNILYLEFNQYYILFPIL